MLTLLNVKYLSLFVQMCCKKGLKHLHINKTLVENITHLHSFFFLLRILSGDIEFNPGPTESQIHTLDIFHFNIRHKIQIKFRNFCLRF